MFHHIKRTGKNLNKKISQLLLISSYVLHNTEEIRYAYKSNII